MFNFVIIIISLCAGFAVRQLKLVDAQAYKGINIWVIYVALPAVALKFIPQIEWGIAYLFTALLPFLVFTGSYLFFQILNRFLQLSKRTLNTLILVSGLSNTSFIGFPLIITFFGEAYLKVGIVSDQTTFFILSSLGVLIALSTQKKKANMKNQTRFILTRIFTFPPLIACIIACLIPDILMRDSFQGVFNAFAATVSPLALFSIGMQLNFQKWKMELGLVTVSLLYKLVLAPLLLILISFLLGLEGIFYQVSLFEMAMPCLVATSIVVQQFGLNAKLANTIIGVSILVGLAFAFIWHSVLVTLL